MEGERKKNEMCFEIANAECVMEVVMFNLGYVICHRSVRMLLNIGAEYWYSP